LTAARHKAPLTFTAPHRDSGAEDRLNLTSVGIDIGSSTSHLAFTNLGFERVGSRYVLVAADVLHQSRIILTPYRTSSSTQIDGEKLALFFAEERDLAGLAREDVDTGAVILTGMAARRENTAEIGEALAQEAGEFVTVAAGDVLEAVMAAHGSGAVACSKNGTTALNVDIGGGTTKIALCSEGRVEGVTAVDAGARLLTFDDEGLIAHIEPALHSILQDSDLDIRVGDAATSSVLDRVASCMADGLAAALPGNGLGTARSHRMMRLPRLTTAIGVDRLIVSGGVAEYMGGRQAPCVNDLGPYLARQFEARLVELGLPFECAAAGIRSTVAGAAVDTVQVSGSTVFVEPTDILPLLGVPVVAPEFGVGEDHIDVAEISGQVRRALGHLGLDRPGQPVGVSVSWRGTASFDRLDAFCRGLAAGVSDAMGQKTPLLLVSDGDVGGLLGMQLRDTPGFSNPIVSIDGINLQPFEYVDVGEFMPGSGALPLVVKSLLFVEQVNMTSIDV